MRYMLAMNIAPVLLRLVLGLTFLWAGAAKLTQNFEPSPQQLALYDAWQAGNPVEPDPTPAQAPETERESQAPAPPPAQLPAQPETQPETEPETESETQPQLETQPRPQPTPVPEADPQPEPEPTLESPAQTPPDAQRVAFNQPDPIAGQPRELRRLYGLAFLTHAAANPGTDEAGNPKLVLWPPVLADGKLPIYTAWFAAISELLFGLAVLFGFFTRLSALPLAGTMIVAAWLTVIGPAIQSGDTLLFVLPTGVFDLKPFVGGGVTYAYGTFLWQLALLAIALALALMGPGALSIDRMLFGAPAPARSEPGDPFDDDAVEFVKMRNAPDDD
ncbi:MAG: DoxX family membrane protein [Planctomycetota bacterium]